MFNKSKKIGRSAAAICLVMASAGLSGCSAAIVPEPIFNNSSSYFNEYEAGGEGDYYLVGGTVHQADDNNAILVWVESEDEISIQVKGTMTRRDGEIRLVYEAPDKTLTVLADSGRGEAKTTEIDEELKLEKGLGCLRFDGADAVYDFDLSFGGRISGRVQYYTSRKEAGVQDEKDGKDGEDGKDGKEPAAEESE